MVRGPVSHALDIVARVAVKGLLRVGLSMAIPALVSLRNHGLEIIFASVFHSDHNSCTDTASYHNSLSQTCRVLQGIGIGN